MLWMRLYFLGQILTPQGSQDFSRGSSRVQRRSNSLPGQLPGTGESAPSRAFPQLQEPLTQTALKLCLLLLRDAPDARLRCREHHVGHDRLLIAAGQGIKPILECLRFGVKFGSFAGHQGGSPFGWYLGVSGELVAFVGIVGLHREKPSRLVGRFARCQWRRVLFVGSPSSDCFFALSGLLCAFLGASGYSGVSSP